MTNGILLYLKMSALVSHQKSLLLQQMGRNTDPQLDNMRVRAWIYSPKWTSPSPPFRQAQGRLWVRGRQTA